MENESNIQMLQWPSSYQSVTYCYQRDISTRKLFKINSTFTFAITKKFTIQLLTVTKEMQGNQTISNIFNIEYIAVTKQLPVSYLLLPKRYKDTNIIKSIINNDQRE